MGKEEKNDGRPVVEIVDTRPPVKIVEEMVNEIFFEEYPGLTKAVRNHGCTLAPYIPSGGVEGETSYYMVTDAIKRDIAVVRIYDGLSSSHISEVEYVGPPEEENQWQRMIDDIFNLPHYD